MSGYLWEVGLSVISVFIFICFLLYFLLDHFHLGVGVPREGIGFAVSQTCNPQGLLEPQQERLVIEVNEAGACET